MTEADKWKGVELRSPGGERYYLQHKLGTGMSGLTFSCIDSKGQVYACKVMRKQLKESQLYAEFLELQNLRLSGLKHNIEMYDLLAKDDHCFLIMPLFVHP